MRPTKDARRAFARDIEAVCRRHNMSFYADFAELSISTFDPDDIEDLRDAAWQEPAPPRAPLTHAQRAQVEAKKARDAEALERFRQECADSVAEIVGVSK